MDIGHFIAAVASITVIDLVLSGDNAAVIGLAIRELPPELRTRAALVGTAGAIILRVTFTAVATILLSLKFLSAIGGVLLLFITWRLIRDQDGEEGKEERVSASNRFWTAVGTIIIADLSMAFDNVMGVAGAAHGHVGLVIFGLALSIPILIAGSTWLSYLMNKYPIIIYVGAGVLARTSLSMIFNDRGLALERFVSPLLLETITIISIFVVIVWGQLRINRQKKFRAERA